MYDLWHEMTCEALNKEGQSMFQGTRLLLARPRELLLHQLCCVMYFSTLSLFAVCRCTEVPAVGSGAAQRANQSAIGGMKQHRHIIPFAVS